MMTYTYNSQNPIHHIKYIYTLTYIYLSNGLRRCGFILTAMHGTTLHSKLTTFLWVHSFALDFSHAHTQQIVYYYIFSKIVYKQPSIEIVYFHFSLVVLLFLLCEIVQKTFPSDLQIDCCFMRTSFSVLVSLKTSSSSAAAAAVVADDRTLSLELEFSYGKINS